MISSKFRFLFLIPSLFLMILWDVYSVAYSRIFEVMGVLSFFLYVLYLKGDRLKLHDNDLVIISVIAILLIFVPSGQYATHLAVLCGIFIFILSRNLDSKDVLSALKLLIAVLIILQLFDFLYYRYTGVGFEWFDGGSFNPQRRWDPVTGFFRAVGPFSEANAYASTLSLLFLPFWTHNKVPGLLFTLAVAFSLMLSISMFGWMMAGLFILLLLIYAHGVRWTLVALFLGAPLAVVVVPDEFLFRLHNFQEDPSIRARILGNEFNFYQAMLPSGFHSLEKDAILGSNGVSFVVDAFGVFSILVFIIVLRLLTFNQILLFMFLNLTYPVYVLSIFYIVFPHFILKKSVKIDGSLNEEYKK